MAAAMDTDNFALKPTWDKKGTGIFTNIQIETGTVIVREMPVVRHYERPEGFDTGLIPGLIQQFDAMSRAVQDEFLTLHCRKMLDEDDDFVFEFLRNYTRADGANLTLPECRMYKRVVVILWSCQIGFIDAAGAEHRGVFLRASRFNHRCWPNVILNISTEGQMTMRARHRILAGAELTISYIEMDLLRHARRQKLLQDFGFECLCDVCDEEDLRPDAPLYEARIAELSLSDMHETMRMYKANEFGTLQAEDCVQLGQRCAGRWVTYCRLFWNDWAFYELCNIADLWARQWQLLPDNNVPANLEAARLVTEWRRAMNSVFLLGRTIMDADDHHLMDCRRALATGFPTIIQPLPPAEGENPLSPTPQGRARRIRSATPFDFGPVSGLSPGGVPTGCPQSRDNVNDQAKPRPPIASDFVVPSVDNCPRFILLLSPNINNKGAAVHLNRMLAAEVAGQGHQVRVNSIAPGVFPSETTAGGSGGDQKSHIPENEYADRVPAARPGEDEDMAQAVLFFAAAQCLDGQTRAVDGGYTLAAGR
ncbi:hypothetical protein PG999_007547 [Apiospora kogelbergensis]|uniref:SET domain-containing protein n=1 Tax=Apiospora kogelbergensis TaxID=1337665 RepID=A0AAW0QLP4_9PEZI